MVAKGTGGCIGLLVLGLLGGWGGKVVGREALSMITGVYPAGCTERIYDSAQMIPVWNREMDCPPGTDGRSAYRVFTGSNITAVGGFLGVPFAGVYVASRLRREKPKRTDAEKFI